MNSLEINTVVEQNVTNELLLEAPDAQTHTQVFWERNFSIVVDRLRVIAKMNPAAIASELCNLFSEYATIDSLKSDFTAINDEMLDLIFINDCMREAFGELGHGSFSTAYRLDDQWIIKINDVCDDLSPKDGAFDWIKTCTSIQGNSYVPKIASVAQKNFQYFAVVEFLNENETGHEVDGFCFTDLAECVHDENFDLVDYIKEVSSHAMFCKMIGDNSHDLIQLALAYEKCRDSANLDADLQSFNLMFREGETPVVNDPFSTGTNISLCMGSSFEWAMA
jgi:hypothetical protein